MKTVTLAITLLVSFNSMAGLQAYKSSTGKITTISDASFDTAVNGKSPLCVKDGGRVIAVNDAFKDMGLRYGDCSNGDAATRKHKALGFSVMVVKVAELSDAKIRQVLGK